ncbi:helix-turn-helix transcriptional regulator [Vacuolonema iberomarrocanum]|uniref:AraC family transcriptional regulator n=1 Tax=Vacuolonema iberomarrocanum TaxID=3454632 RepID=UPI003F6DBB2D
MQPSLPETQTPAASGALMTDFTRASDVTQVLPSGPILSSQPGQWNGVHLSYYQHPPYEIPEVASKHHLILVHLEVPTQVEQWMGTEFQKIHFQVGSVLVVPAQTPHSANWDAENRYLLLSLDPIAFLDMAQSVDNRTTAELLPHFTAAEPLIHGIGLSLKAELESGNLGGRLYADSLCTTLFNHLLRHYTTKVAALPTLEGGLPRYRLRRVMEYVDAYLDRDLALAELAAIAQLSPNYFTRLFKQSTGLTPHQYVIQQRVERAKRLLHEGHSTLADVALAVGFAHQSHLNLHFKRWVGVTPKAFINNQ